MLKDPLFYVVQEVDTCGKHTLNCIRHARKWKDIVLVDDSIIWWCSRACQLTEESFILIPNAPATFICADQYALVDQHTHDFFHEEGVPFGSTQDGMTQHFREIVRVQEG